MSVSRMAIRMLAEEIRTLSSLSVTGTYAAIGTPFDHPVRILFVQNLTDATLMFSFDGIEDHFPLPANGFLLLDVTTNQSLNQGCYFSQGQQMYVKELGTPLSGDVYVSVFYGSTL